MSALPKEENQETETKNVDGVAGERLRSFIERIERLEEEKAVLAEDIKQVLAEAKGVGFDVKTIKRVVALRKMDAEKRQEEQALLETYSNAVQLNLF